MSERGSAIGPWSSVWRPGDEPGMRCFTTPVRLPLDVGVTPWGNAIDGVTVCYETWGTLNADASNAVLVLHGFTADSHAAGPAGPAHPEAGWWDGAIGSGKAIDTDRFFVVCPNVLGGCQGTTGPSSLAPDGEPWGSRWPVTTIRDMVAAERVMADQLGIHCWYGVVGMSLGGMRALEWSIGTPDRVARAIVIGCGAQSSAEQIALQSIQLQAITDDDAWCAGDYYDKGDGRGPVRGMGLARKLGHLTYRSEIELHQRFANRAQAGEDPLAANRGGRYGVQSYIDHAATRLERRFDPNTYLAITEAMNHHDVGRGRGGMAAAMKLISATLTIVGLDGDRLYPIRQQRELAFLAPVPTDVQVVHSMYGHDAFLVDVEQTGGFVQAALRA
jgi:homoserine O-acetyltransferase/O-succinyltransferase